MYVAASISHLFDLTNSGKREAKNRISQGGGFLLKRNINGWIKAYRT